MISTPDNEILTDLLVEVEGYLPEMRHCLLALKKSPDNKEPLGELYRMAHTINGLSSMVGLHDLCRTAVLLENVLERITSSSLIISDEIIELMSDTTHHIQAFCTSIRDDEKDISNLYEMTLSRFQETTGEQLIEGNSNIAVEETYNPLIDPDTDEDANDEVLDDIFSNLASDDLIANSDNIDDILPAVPDDEKGWQQDDFPEPSSIETDTAILESFYEEANEHLDAINKNLNSLSASITGKVIISENLRKVLHSIRRSVHTIKGASAVSGVTQVAKWDMILRISLIGFTMSHPSLIQISSQPCLREPIFSLSLLRNPRS